MPAVMARSATVTATKTDRGSLTEVLFSPQNLERVTPSGRGSLCLLAVSALMREAIGRITMKTFNKIKNSDASQYIARLEEFEGSNFRAMWRNRPENGQKATYEIFSYSTLIALVVPEDSIAWTDPEYHSPTTSRHMGQVRRGLDTMGQSEGK